MMSSRSQDDYVLLGTTIPYSRKNYGRRVFLIAAAILFSVALNLYFIISTHLRGGISEVPKNALDNYQPLNHHPIVDQAAMISTSEPTVLNADEHAVVTTLYTDAFAAAVATLGHTLRRVNISARLILLYLPDQISEASLCLATSSGFEARPVSRISPPHNGTGVHPHFVDQFTKLSLWTMDQIGIKSLVYLDADTLVRRNFDELFSLPFNFGAVPDVYLDDPGFTLGFNAGMLFLRPSSAIFQSMTSQLATANYPLMDAEQSYLNHFFGAEAVRLPYAYNGNLAIKMRKPEMWKATLSEQRIIHYTLHKPFLQGDYEEVPFEQMEDRILDQAEGWGGAFMEETLWWGSMFKEFKKTYKKRVDKCMHMLYMHELDVKIRKGRH